MTTSMDIVQGVRRHIIYHVQPACQRTASLNLEQVRRRTGRGSYTHAQISRRTRMNKRGDAGHAAFGCMSL